MTTAKRRRHPRVPDFPPLEELAPGSPFNPYTLFEGWSIRKAITSAPKLRPGAKLVWVMLADQVYSSDYDSHSERNLAELCGISVRQFRRHLRALWKAKLVHVAPDIGRQNYLWLLWHSLFAGCSPLPPVRSVLGVRSEVSEGSGQKWPTQRNYQRNYQRSDGATRLKATSSSVPLPPNGGIEGEEIGSAESAPSNFRYRIVRPQNPPPDERTENTRAGDAAAGESLVVVKEAKVFWYSLEPVAKRNRFEQAARVHDRIQHFRNYLKDPHAEIARQAQHEIRRALDELRALGFTLHTNGKGPR